MSIDNIENKILESAKAEAEKIIGGAKQKAAELIESAKAANEKRSSEAAKEAHEAFRQHRDQQATSARAANKLKLLARKADLLDEVFDKAVEQFIGDRRGGYRKWLAAQLSSVAGQNGAVVPAEPDRKIVAELLSDVKEGGGLELADESLPLRGGLVLRGDKADIDLSLDTQLVDLKQELLPELAAQAFDSTAVHPRTQ